ncbi:MAG: hypothetical protein OXJ53_06110, partial [Gammaproteobacteria bacterium]|nr:hypothetical protein [Gammaproteobacteria bacterium]
PRARGAGGGGGGPARSRGPAPRPPPPGAVLTVRLAVSDAPGADLLADAVEGDDGHWTFGDGDGAPSCPA